MDDPTPQADSTRPDALVEETLRAVAQRLAWVQAATADAAEAAPEASLTYDDLGTMVPEALGDLHARTSDVTAEEMLNAAKVLLDLALQKSKGDSDEIGHT